MKPGIANAVVSGMLAATMMPGSYEPRLIHRQRPPVPIAEQKAKLLAAQAKRARKKKAKEAQKARCL